VKPYYENPATEAAQVENLAAEIEQMKNLNEETIRVADPTSNQGHILEQEGYISTETPQPKCSRGYSCKVQPQDQMFVQETDALKAFLSSKKQDDTVLADQLWAEGKIKTPGILFEEST
jgi:hypothetical protein